MTRRGLLARVAGAFVGSVLARTPFVGRSVAVEMESGTERAFFRGGTYWLLEESDNDPLLRGTLVCDSVDLVNKKVGLAFWGDDEIREAPAHQPDETASMWCWGIGPPAENLDARIYYDASEGGLTWKNDGSRWIPTDLPTWRYLWGRSRRMADEYVRSMMSV